MFCDYAFPNYNYLLCRYKWSSFRVVAGDTNKSSNEGTEQEIPIRSVHTHRQYIAGNHANDIALVWLQHPVNMLGTNVNTVCLPVYGEQPFTSADTCFVTGWGETKGYLSYF